MIMSQYYNAIPLEMRKNLSSVIIVGFQKPHDNLFIRLDTGRMYRNFARLILEEAPART